MLVAAASIILVNEGYLERISATYVGAVLFGAVYTMLPDIDIPSSKIRGYAAKTLLAVTLASLLAYATFSPKAILIYAAIISSLILYALWFARHRGFYHGKTFGLIMTLPLVFVSIHVMVFAAFGFLLHLALDGELNS